MRTTLGSSRCSSTHSEFTSADSRLMVIPFVARAIREVVRCCVSVAVTGAGGAACEQLHLAAQAEPEGGVQQRGRQGTPGRDGSEEVKAGQVTGQRDNGEPETDALAEPRRCRVLELRRRGEARTDEPPEQPGVWRPRDSGHR